MSDDKVFFMIALGTFGMIVMVIAIIVFVILYQRKMFAKQNEILQIETSKQKELVNAVLTAKEMEQKRIAQELHDEIGSSINAVKMSLIKMKMDEDHKSSLSSELLQISKNVRRISNELMPSVLEELGFHQAIEHLLKKFQITSGLEIRLNYEQEMPFALNKGTQLSLYRIIQELVNNIIKYAEATKIEVIISHHSDQLELRIIDDGIGFIPDQDSLTKGDSLGLKNIKSRIQQIDGEDSYSNVDPRGTEVKILIKRND
ncbi:MAG: hypothetical protein EP305_05500 [Bacteroidetes bacterium]|nr:MAG: hypothetical protein EP305_05500 [Bacteroidota bacterium]